MNGEKFITLAHGNGGRYMRELIEGIFVRHLANPLLDTRCDAAHIPLDAGEVLITTDGFTVQPLEFPGGSIGSLAVHGTVNDLAVGGARPLYLAAAFILEEGLPIDDLRRVVASMRDAAREAGVSIVTGDTKVVERGAADGLFINTAGIGTIPAGRTTGPRGVRPGDRLIVNGALGDHGIAVLAARNELALQIPVRSDCALAELREKHCANNAKTNNRQLPSCSPRF